MRTFVALPVPDDVRARLATALAPIQAAGDHLRWTDPSTWHLTLAFLGEVDDDRLGEVEAAVRRAVTGHRPVDVHLGRPGRFGRGLCYLGVQDEAFATIVALGTAVRSELVAAGLDVDRKPLHPHLTLARQRDRRGRGVSRTQLEDLGAAVGRGRDDDWRWVADEVVVFSSHLGDDPVRHDPLARIPLP